MITLLYMSILIYINVKRYGTSSWRNEREHRLILIIVAITLTNIMSLLPSTTLSELNRRTPPSSKLEFKLIVFIIITFINAAINPLTYGF